MGFATPASAVAIAGCANTDISPNALACQGFYAGNLLSNNPSDIAAQTTHLAALGFAWDGNWNNVEKISGLSGSHSVDFATMLHGISYVAFHFGNGVGGPGNATAFYKLDAGTATDVIALNYNASSNAVLYSTGTVPEPASWALMIAGFGIVGMGLRRRRSYVTA
ncbi:PEPxxWA-CTERM sorting domain-containing protein [Polymorphobacter arshaanensis]|uniref:PEPxxWA-CTERM sorting domain-containing protein n=1 Tax=Glacieibacterium arshaanense TaxID=2511025 RepID=UPI001FB0F8AD|nr:PEPxxWA-CTERM sorting domain-containing protein [Polymorphobacter arshaanensis]